MNKVELVNQKSLEKQEKPTYFRPGDTVAVHVRIKEGQKERIQVFEGVVIHKSGDGINSAFTVRKISEGVGVERVFPVYSPVIQKVVRKRAGVVRRAKLYYLRNLKGQAARIKQRENR